jgi:hypothetical protein
MTYRYISDLQNLHNAEFCLEFPFAAQNVLPFAVQPYRACKEEISAKY